MKYIRILLLNLLALSFLLSSAVGADSIEGVCCYKPGEPDAIRGTLLSDTCNNGEIYLGPPDPTNIINKCGQYTSKQLGCIDYSGACRERVLGNAIYNLPEIFNPETNSGFFPFGDYCSSFKPIDSACVGDSTVEIGGEGQTPSSGGGTIGSPVDSFIDELVSTSPSSDVIELCSNAGGPFGLFNSKYACENLLVGGEKICIYNPHLGGYLSSNLDYSTSQGVFDSENSCIPKTQIRECFDYKTKDNCEANPSNEPNSKLSAGCNWVDAEQYSSTIISGSQFLNLFNEKKGICISKEVDENKYFDGYEYSFRENIITNPSFEEGVVGYDKIEESNLVYNPYTYDGINSYRLTTSSEISQEVNFVKAGISYFVSVYLKANSNTSSTTKIKLSIDEFDSSGSLVNSTSSYTSEITVSNLYEEDLNTFKRAIFRTYNPSSSTASINLELSVTGSDLEIDAIHMEPILATSVVSSSSVFKPVEVISQKASKCNLCFDPLNLNLCTEEKSLYMGDCSYLVESPKVPYYKTGEYLGSLDNIFMQDDRKWNSQSIANSKLFCEMYITEQSCVDPDNYVNSKYTNLHTLTSKTLCTWDEQFGCFKDSDDNYLPDTVATIPAIRTFKEDAPEYFDSANVFSYYKREAAQSENITFVSDDISDFALSCDTVPPTSYIYFTARDSNGTELLLDSSSDVLIGDVTLHIEAGDAEFEQCSDYNIDKRLYVDYDINGNSWYRKIETNLLKDIYPVKEYFVTPSAEELVVDGSNQITMGVYDGSGNIGKMWNFELNIDKNAPLVELLSPSSHYTPDATIVDEILGPSPTLNFSITDYSSVESCSYTLQTTPNVPSTFYTSSGDLDVTQIENGSFEFEVPITKTSPNPDFYKLTVTCSDIFAQEESYVFAFYIDFNTDFLVIDPIPYLNYTFDFGYINSDRDLVAVSSERDLSKCSLAFPESDFTGSENLLINYIDEGFTIDGTFSNTRFFNNITGEISFLSDGVKRGVATCEDGLGNIIEREITYYYDTAEPELNSYSIFGTTIGGQTNVVESNGNYYVNTDEAFSMNLSIDGSGSWVSEDVSVYLVKTEGELEEVSVNTESGLFSDSYVGNLVIENFQIEKEIFRGFDTDEEKLYQMNYSVIFNDKAGNFKDEIVSYYFDNSIIDYKFGGDIISKDGSILYTKVENPNIELTFNSPSYRTFTCSVRAEEGRDIYQYNDLPTSNIMSFNLRDIGETLSVTEVINPKITFSCTDIYGISIERSYVIVHDDKTPILKNIRLLGGNSKFYENSKTKLYDDLVDKLVFELEDTNEVGYDCAYRFVSATPGNDVYSCDSSYREFETSESGFVRTADLFVMKGRGDSGMDNPICVRTDLFKERQEETIANSKPLKTSLFVEAYCTDKVGLKTQTKMINVKLDYVLQDLAGLEFKYEDGFAYPIVTSFEPFDSITISLFENGKPAISILTQYREEGSVYIYESSEGIDLSALEDDTHYVFAIAKDPNDNVVGIVSAPLIADSSEPVAEIIIPDENSGKVYSEEFLIDFSASDVGSSIDKVELYLENKLIYSSKNLSSYDRNYLREPVGSENYFNNDLSGYFGTVVFKGEKGRVYTYTLIAYDDGGNKVEVKKTIEVRDGMSITLVDSENSFVDPSGFSWITKDNAPTISFKTSKFAQSCQLLPMTDEVWVDVTNDPIISEKKKEIRNSQEFSYQLSEFGGYDLSKIDDRTSNVKIICNYNNTYYNYTRTIKLIDFMPDYVLTSSEGFVLNEQPETVVDVLSVGPYRYLNCRYSLDGRDYQFFNEQDSITFTKRFEFVSSGTHTLKLQCEDLVGNRGPEKEYEFYVDLAATLDIEEITLEGNGKTFEVSDDNIIYVSETQGLDLSFRLNKKNNIGCSYMINSNRGLSRAVTLFKKLFSYGTKVVDPNLKPYLFSASGLEFEEDTNLLTVSCGVAGENSDSFSKDFQVIYDVTSTNVSVSRESLN